MSRPRIWVLLGNRRGDNNQLLALGEALCTPLETRTIEYKRSVILRMLLSPRGMGHVTAASRQWLRPPWPDLVIGIGRRTVPVARWIHEQSGGRTSLVRLGHPRADNQLFDLIITTPQYPVPAGENVIRLPLAMNRFRAPPPPTSEERAWLDARPRPHLLLSLGGTALLWRLDLAELRIALGKLVARARDKQGTLIIVGSPRTPKKAWAIVHEATAGADNVATIASNELRYAVLLADADEQFVTADSVSMISEAIVTGKPVGLIPIRPDFLARRLARGPERSWIRDPRRFWAEVEARGLVGTVDAPLSGDVEDPVEVAVAAVRAGLPHLFG